MANDTSTDRMSLEQVEGDTWGLPPADATRLVATVHQLRTKPLGDLEPEDLRMLLSQQVGVEVLIPRALRLLSVDPLLEGDFYPGDVLVAVMKAPAGYWSAHPDQLGKVREILDRLGDGVDNETRQDIQSFQAKTAGLG
jgi:hypothetical protein